MFVIVNRISKKTGNSYLALIYRCDNGYEIYLNMDLAILSKMCPLSDLASIEVGEEIQL